MRYASFTTAKLDAAKAGTTALVAAPTNGTAVWVRGIYAHALDAGTVVFKNGLTAVSGTIPVAALGSISMPVSSDQEAPWFKCDANTAFNVTLSANTDLDGVIVYELRKVV